MNKTDEANKAEAIVAGAIDGAVVEVGQGDQGWDVLVRPRGASESIALELKWVGDGWPGDVRRLAAHVPEPWPVTLVAVARRFSPGALDWLSAHGANWADETGRARIVVPHGLIVIREPTREPERLPQTLSWSPSARSLGELLLARPQVRLRVNKLAKQSGWSQAQVANVLSRFDAAGWTQKEGTKRGPGAWRTLVDPDGLLSSWSAAIAEAPRARRSAHRATADVMGLLHEALAPALEGNTTWALSGWPALELRAPFMTTVPSLHIYVAEDDFAGPLSDAMEAAGLREVEEGARVIFSRADRHLLALAERERGLPVVSAPRLYADLTAMGGRGHDAAEHVKSEVIDPVHRIVRQEAEALSAETE